MRLAGSFCNLLVISKINISEQDRRELFEAEFNPISFFTFLYFFDSVEFSSVYSGAYCCGGVPCVRAYQIRRPKGPGSALVWPGGIDGAGFSAIGFFKEDAVLCCWVFDE